MSEPRPILEGSAARYELLTLLAKGGMSSIYLARTLDQDIDFPFVVAKQLPENLARRERFVEMFVDEARISFLFDHPNVVRFYDRVGKPHPPTIIMEYLTGESLAYLARSGMRKGRLLPIPLAVAIVAQAAAGLAYAHQLKDENGEQLDIIHRDVSPQNIIVLFSGGVKLVDFGIAQARFRLTETATGVRKGKTAYMSPEQALGHALDARSDIFSMGIVLWEALTGWRLFKRKVEFDSLKAISVADVPSPCEQRPDIDPDLEALVFKALAKNPDDRFETATAMAKALRGYLQHSEQPTRKRDIARYYEENLGDLLKTKRRLLKAMESSDAEISSVPALAPDAEVTMPESPEGGEGSDSMHLAQSEKDLIRNVTADSGPQFQADLDDPSLSSIDLGKDDDDRDREHHRSTNVAGFSLPPGWDPKEAGKEDPDAAMVVAFPSYSSTGGGASLPPAPKRPKEPSWLSLRMQAAGAGLRAFPGWLRARLGGLPGLFRAIGRSALQRQLVLPLVIAFTLLATIVVFAALWPSETGDPDGKKPATNEPVVAPDNGPPPLALGPRAYLTILTVPEGCPVRLGNKDLLDKTPIKGELMEAGKPHLLTISCPDHEVISQQIVARHEEQLVLRFEPEPNNPPPKVETVRRKRHGYLKLNTDPWTAVYFKGKKIGLTPLNRSKLPIGRHRLVLVNKKAGIRKTIRIRIRPGKTTRLYRKLKK